jgi:hypothetical protein
MTTHKHISILLSFLAAMTLGLPVQPTAQPTFQSILVVVQVKDCSSGEPLEGARVTVVDVTQDDRVLAQGFTDPNGKFSTVVLILAFNVPDAAEKIDVLVEKEGYTVGTSVKLVMQGPTGQFISVSACLVGSGSRTEQPVCSPSASPTGPTVTLPPGRSIQEAIDQASEGAVIQLQPGEYAIPTSLWITKGISLIGLGTRPDPDDPTRTVPDPTAVVLRGNRTEPVLIIEAEGLVLIENVTVQEGSGAGPEERGGGVHITNSSDVTLHCVVLMENVRFGVFAKLSQVQVEESQVLNTQPATEGRDGHGLRIRGSRVHILKVILRGNGASGLAARDFEGEPSHVIVEESTVEQNVFNGLSVFDASRLEVRSSRIANNQPFQGQFGDGVFAGAEAQLVLEENVIEGHRPMGQFARAGVILTEDVVAVLRGNQIKNNDWGVMVGDRDIPLEFIEAEFVENVFSMNDQCGLWVDEDETITILGSGNRFEERPGQDICGAVEKIPEGFKASGGNR